MQKDSLFYMANLYPEIGRMFDFFEQGKIEAGENAKKRSLGIVDNILSFKDIKIAGREEWYVVKNFIEGFEKLDSYEREILKNYAKPFSFKFMNQYISSA
jgi:hypothetical protein